MSREYVHVLDEDNAEVVIGGGTYQGRETTLQHDGKDVLYVVGGTSRVACCCGSGLGTCFITVPGFVSAWQGKKNDAGVPVSEVEPIADAEARDKIKETLEHLYGIRNITFW